MSEFFKEEFEDKVISQIFDDMMVNHDRKDELIKYFKSTDPKMRSAFGAEVANGNILDDVEILSGIDIPILMINGEQDKLVNQEYLKKLQGEFAFQNEIIPNSGHYPPIENPQKLNEMLNEFVASV
jgi:pimeloyl-ACP methyl ester carboxylesterase